ncbi:gibberellin 2-oxidase, partial [Genlisea aurea]
MVVLSPPPILDNYIKTCKKSTATISPVIPAIDLSDPQAKTLIVKACEELGFFKVVNHGVPTEFLTRIETEALNFFRLPQSEKDKSGPANPFGYGNKKIGSNGDVGWVEYLLFSTSPVFFSGDIFAGIPDSLRSAVKDYVGRVKKMTSRVLEMITEEMKIGDGDGDCLSRLINDAKSDCLLRLNHYPPAPSPVGNLIGFGEHTDPQIISVSRSNNVSGLQICLRDGEWVSVPPDEAAFFFNVGDMLQVMTNGRLGSVKHRVVVAAGEGECGSRRRISAVFFGGPP